MPAVASDHPPRRSGLLRDAHASPRRGLPHPLRSVSAVFHDLDGLLPPGPCDLFQPLTPMGLVFPAPLLPGAPADPRAAAKHRAIVPPLRPRSPGYPGVRARLAAPMSGVGPGSGLSDRPCAAHTEVCRFVWPPLLAPKRLVRLRSPGRPPPASSADGSPKRSTARQRHRPGRSSPIRWFRFTVRASSVDPPRSVPSRVVPESIPPSRPCVTTPGGRSHRDEVLAWSFAWSPLPPGPEGPHRSGVVSAMPRDHPTRPGLPCSRRSRTAGSGLDDPGPRCAPDRATSRRPAVHVFWLYRSLPGSSLRPSAETSVRCHDLAGDQLPAPRTVIHL